MLCSEFNILVLIFSTEQSPHAISFLSFKQLVIFTFHVLTLLILIISSFVEIGKNGGSIWKENWNYSLPISKSGGIGMDLYLGFSVSLLGMCPFM